MKNLFKSCLMMLFIISTMIVRAQVPIMSSNPSAPSVIFLDFDGQTVDNTAWNNYDINGTSIPIYCGASGMTTAQITEAFNRVAEDYRPFNVNVTTDSTKYFAAPAAKRMRVIGTISSSWYGSAGGVSFVGSFTWGDNTPCFVFTALLFYSPKKVSEAASHEAGHTLSLYHQAAYNGSCVLTSEYNYGQGTGEIGWAPIMGVGYSQNLTLWNNGPNPYGCTNYQNDLDIITHSNGVTTADNGFTYRNDDYAATFAGAYNTPFVSNQFTVNGIIEKNSDQDMFKVTQPTLGRFQLNAIPYNVGTANAGSDLDLQVTLYNSSQTQLNVYNPGTSLNSVIDTTLNPGTYYLRVEGKGNIYAPNYASLGSYTLLGNSLSTLPLRKLLLHGELNRDKHKLTWIIDADEQVSQQILESSTDGRNFSPATVSDATARSYEYSPNISGTIQYRLNVTFDNGRQYYSNTVTLRKTGETVKPKLVSNLIGANILEVSSPGIYTYAAYDLNGKILVQGKLVNVSKSIIVPNMPGGIYVIRFANETDQWIEKFVKQ